MKTKKTIVVFCMASVAICSLAVAEGWKMPNLNPFNQSKSSKHTTVRISDEPKSSVLPKLPVPSLPKMTMPTMKMPGWMPGSSSSAAKSRARSKQPSTLDKLNKGTKDFFGKTKEILMPWSTPKKTSTNRSKSKKNTFLGMSLPWPSPKKQPEVRTVQDFMALDRPTF